MIGHMYHGGQWVEAATGARKQVRNPATHEAVGSVPVAEREDVRLAVAAAHEAFPGWSGMTAKERSAFLYKAYEGLMTRKEEVGRWLTLEQGKPLKESIGEVAFAAEFLLWYAEEAKRIPGETIPASVSTKRILTMRQPVGVVGAITPWNFPASMITRKLAPALAAGCTVVLKPSDYTPLTAVMLFHIFHEAGFPPGVVNLVTGKGSVVGDELVTHPQVRKITFTGSTEVGKQLMRGAADTVKRLSLELGGHAPFIVFADADLEQAAEACIASKFRNAGQTCICANRIYVEEDVMDSFAEKFAAKASALRLGNGMEPGTDIGPLIDQQALEKSELHVKDAVAKGARIAAGGRRWEQNPYPGAFFEPTVLTHASPSMLVCREETFGPVAPLISFKTEAEVIRMANDTEYGLAAYVFTQNLGTMYRVAESLQYGIVGVNDALPSVAQAPFGGWKESGLGREGGKYGLESFLELKYVSIGL